MDYLPLSQYYLYCSSCKTYFDRWKYGSLEDTGHSKCKVRTLNGSEYLLMLSEDKNQGCLNEQFLDNVVQQRGQKLVELANVLYRKKGYRLRGD